jgi:hypothetical protein
MSRQVARGAAIFMASLLVILIAAPHLAAAASLGDTRFSTGFISYLYQAYSNGDHPDLLPPEAIYDPDLLALVKRDVSFASSRGGPALLEQDPICLCQDYTDLQIKNMKVLYQDPDHAVVAVAFADGDNRGGRDLSTDPVRRPMAGA